VNGPEGAEGPPFDHSERVGITWFERRLSLPQPILGGGIGLGFGAVYDPEMRGARPPSE
jgi:hypothetical protein